MGGTGDGRTGWAQMGVWKERMDSDEWEERVDRDEAVGGAGGQRLWCRKSGWTEMSVLEGRVGRDGGVGGAGGGPAMFPPPPELSGLSRPPAW